MEEKPRQWGIDLARMISTYGIVLIHSGDYAPYDRLALQIKDLFGFSLPFFLAASFYLLANPQKKSKLSNSISSRCNRLLIPYFAWSFVYIAARVIKDLVTHKVVDLGTLFRDPFAILFFGAAAVHLYFLPLLFTGNLFGIIISKYKLGYLRFYIAA
jgi:fucose 4-O-acetylase-like acetyltransferase